MLQSGSSVVQVAMRELLRTLGGLLNDVENPISLTGHTDAAPYVGGNRGYSNWELSADRATASRRELIAGGMKGDKVLRVMGVGPVVPLDKSNPLDPMNRRIAIVVLNQAAQQRILNGTEADAPEPDAVRPVIDALALPAGPGDSRSRGTGRNLARAEFAVPAVGALSPARQSVAALRAAAQIWAGRPPLLIA